jgi:very-short-patch-repair endonuclease
MKSPIRASPQLLRLQQHAAQMRREPTASERVLWAALSGGKLGASFRRQVPLLGKYIADFFAPAVGVVVEVDGKYHGKRGQQDERRDRALRRAGFRVVRVEAEAVLGDLEGALGVVRQVLGR